ncbi:MAG: T9SS type A sorting domain-containing protein [Paludibacteraceae bacterium]|nr:T9SS type A sorting domain-containing protein [Paludibacteraceae bacterium]
MRDRVTVLGGFPVGKYASPGMTERQALMSAEVSIPQADKELEASEYETILQISDVNPRLDSATFNDKAVKFYDDNLAVTQTEQTIRYEYKNRNIVHRYHVDYVSSHDIVGDYMQYADFKTTTGGNVTRTETSNTLSPDGNTRYVTFGTATAEKDCWHLSYPVKTNYNVKVETGGNTDNKTVSVYDPVTNLQLAGTAGSNTCHRFFVGNGSLTGLQFWQTIKSLPAGKYKLVADMAGGYRNKFSDTLPTNIFFHVYDSDDKDCISRVNGQDADRVMLKTFGSVTNDDDRDRNRNRTYRYEIEFTQTTTGPLTLRIEVEDGRRNTRANNATYGTDDGGDPDPIPALYYQSDGGNNPNRRELYLSNYHLYELSDEFTYVEYQTDDVLTDNDEVEKLPSEVIDEPVYKASKHRTTLRKRVLSMPDVTNPVFCIGPGNFVNGGQAGDTFAHVERKKGRLSKGPNPEVDDPNYVEYSDVYWNGFTIRNGFLHDHTSVHDGGAGVAMYEGAHLQNCIVTDNFAASMKQKGGGLFCDGSTSTIEGCFILNNSTSFGTQMDTTQEFAGGMFIYEGTCFNTLIANNYARGFGGGVGLCVGRFYNNTVAYNYASAHVVSGTDVPAGDVGKQVGGVRIATNAGTQLFMGNTIIYGNNGLAIDITNGKNAAAPFIHCYIQSEAELLKPNFLYALATHEEDVLDGNYGINNVFLNGVPATADNTPFAEDVKDGVYTAGSRKTNNFALRQTEGVNCVNRGTEDFEYAMHNAMRDYLRRNNLRANTSDANIEKEDFYKAVVGAVLPSTDVVYDARVQDCKVDIGAYEFNGAIDIRPDTVTYPGHAVYYVSLEATNGGDASASSTRDAACSMKFQKILDAAGRYKHMLFTEPRYATVSETPEAGKPDKSWEVEVRLAGDVAGTQSYIPTRTTIDDGHTADNLLDYSIIVPRGVHLLGGYEPVLSDTSNFATAFSDQTRDPLYYRTSLDGLVTSSTGSSGNVYHVVTFTENLYDTEENLFEDGSANLLRGQLATALSAVPEDRAVIDGCFIRNGYANAPEAENRRGGGAVVPGYAHIRNCVVTDNYALLYGGGLYLTPGALVSGTIVSLNTADIGGGIYVEEPQTFGEDVRPSYIFTSTVCQNTSSTNAGGLWFGTNVRVNSSAFWKNTSNDFANVAGNFAANTARSTTHPFIYSAIEVRHVEGQGNLSVSALESEGVRWDAEDPFGLDYYPIEMSSVLSRTGISYADYIRQRAIFPTLALRDIAGVARMEQDTAALRLHGWPELTAKDNGYIEIGARALNSTFAMPVDLSLIMHRLYVTDKEDLDRVAARALQENSDIIFATGEEQRRARMYAQPGSSVLNPMQFLSDALDYIVRARKIAMTDDRPEARALRNARFEVILGAGTHMPGHNAQGEQDATESVRTNTFAIPEGVTVIGGVDLDRYNYGQAGYADYDYTGTETDDISFHFETTLNYGTGNYNDYTIHYATTDSIRARRSMYDYNQNSIIEPWEYANTTRLTGEVPTSNDEGNANVYHVITCFADSTKIGALPTRFRKFDGSAFSDPIEGTDETEECEQSRVRRTIMLDGITIMGGHANHIEDDDEGSHLYNTKTYFRGGGIFVDGNWTKDFDDGVGKLPTVLDKSEHDIPLMARNCQFVNNQAGNGGAIYSNGSLRLYSSYFTQNLARGPDTETDQRYIPWTAGGCIATNAYCGAVNCIFANNEAQRGNLPITAAPDPSAELITDADARQGFAGVISAAEASTVRLFNCDLVKNKAVGYPAIFNFLGNEYYDGLTHEGMANPSSQKHFAFNTLFWGNEATGITSGDVPATLKAKYNTYAADYFNYTPALRDQYTNELAGNLDTTAAANIGNRIEGLFFCAYENDHALQAIQLENAATDYRTLRLTDEYETQLLPNLFTSLGEANHNIHLSPINSVTAGPNFVQPSDLAGIDGYMQNADWVPSRINSLTDNGWGYLHQHVTRRINYYVTAEAFTHAGLTYNVGDNVSVEVYNTLSAVEKARLVPHYRGEQYVFDNAADGKPGNGVYNYFSAQHEAEYDMQLMPIGEQYYMNYTREGDSEQKPMLRISGNPRMNIDSAFIDIGVYEYQYVQLDLPGNEVDTVWITTSYQARDRDGLTYATATTNFTSALNTLLRSWNNHDKVVCFIGGTEDEPAQYTPTDFVDNRLSFLITMPDGRAGDIFLPDEATGNDDYGIRSITFLGGWGPNIKERNPKLYPTMLKIDADDAHGYDNEALNQMVYIGDMSRRTMKRTYRADVVDPGDSVVPIIFDGIIFHNTLGSQDPASGRIIDQGGSAIYYSWQRYHTLNTEGDFSPNFMRPLLPTLDAAGHPLPKLTLRNCIIADNGRRDVADNFRSTAVRIEDGGGSSLIYNTLFHSNAGSPLYVTKESHDATMLASYVTDNSAVLVNNTFALNGMRLTLGNENSEIHNSIFWRENYDESDGSYIPSEQFRIGTLDYAELGSRFTTNAVSYLPLPAGQARDNTYRNILLHDDNSNVFEGPNFEDPLNGSRINRNFGVNPAVRIINAANDTLYAEKVLGLHVDDLTREDAVKQLRADFDLGRNARLSDQGMERGAYECIATMQRVLYVRPSELPGRSGHSWLQAFGRGEMQKAVDIAAVYSYFNPGRHAYVFVKGSNAAQQDVNLNLRNGVEIYGSIANNFLDTAYHKDGEYADAEVARYIHLVRARRPALAASGTARTRMSSLHTDDDNPFSTGCLVDGFEVSNEGTLGVSPIRLDKDNVTLRNMLITSNRMADGVPLVSMQNGLIYNSLIYDNVCSEALQLGPRALSLNNTVVVSQAGAVAVSAVADKSVVNTISLNSADHSTARTGASGVACNDITTMFAPYFRPDGNVYTLPARLTMHQPLYYQHHEFSPLIGQGVETPVFGSQATADNSAVSDLFGLYAGSIDFDHDRDVLGNPRRLFGRVDVGALETWLVTSDITLTNQTNAVSAFETTDEQKEGGYLANYGGHLYPHQGSVCYIDRSKTVVLGLGDSDERLFTGSETLRPGYLLLRPGASLLGQGNSIQAEYLSVERQLGGQQYALMSVPFDMSLNNVSEVSSDASHTWSERLMTSDFTAYRYDGASRSAWRYRFKDDQSACWKPLTDSVRACDGWLLDMGASSDACLRLTGWAPDAGRYAYAEDDRLKYVELKQHDLRSSSGGKADYTTGEDMGWNLKGIPYLAATLTTGSMTDGLYDMNVPHVVYTMDDDGNYLTQQSWAVDATLSLSQAFFTQTATIDTSEWLAFRHPLPAGGKAVVPHPVVALYRADGRLVDKMELQVRDEGGNMDYKFGADGLKLMSFDHDATQMYAINSSKMRFSLLSTAPVGVEIPVGLRVGSAGTYQVALPGPEAFGTHRAVWFIDHQSGSRTNLLDGPAYLTFADTGDYEQRFAIQIDGDRLPAPSARYRVYYDGSRLHIDGLNPSDRVNVYTISGQLISYQRVNTDLVMRLPSGIYLFSVNGYGQKFVVR